MAKSKDVPSTPAGPESVQVCELPLVPERPVESGLDPNRVSLIRVSEKKWVNFTRLHYCFLDAPATWRGSDTQKGAVDNAFQTWKELGIGLEFERVQSSSDAEIRIGFERGGSWSYVGRDCIDLVPDPNQRTMNFGWDLTTPYGRDTALHEIGHALGFPHEHQNPNAGIEWDEEAVYTHFAGPPNNWPRQKTHYNILRQVEASSVEGSDWDRNSIMHYQFAAGLILRPDEFRHAPLIPEPGLSPADIDTVRYFYPPAKRERLPELRPFEAHRINIAAGQQLDFVIEPQTSRRYTIQTFGRMDTVMVLFEEIDGNPVYYDGDDDSGFDLNARIDVRLVSGRRYFIRVRLFYAQSRGEGALIMY